MHNLIQNMDEIYTKAQLTIVAAAGKNPHYGLPGVGSRPRSRLRHIEIGDVKLVQILRPGSDTPKSTWWKRAWTYQEGVLSRRKLIFTDHEVFFICNKTHLAESLSMHAGTLSFHDSITFSELMFPSGARGYMSYLRDISMRVLSHSCDALNTCLGILKATNTPHVWGVPIETTSTSGNHELALCWRHNSTTQRRPEFPSWSWAGWDDAVDMENCITTDPFITVLIGDGHQEWQTLRVFHSSGNAKRFAGSSNAPRFLKLTGSVLDAALLNDQWPDIADFGTGAMVHQDDRPRPYFTLSISGTPAVCVLYMDQEMGTSERLHDVIAFGVQNDNQDCCVSALLLKPLGAVYTRVSMIKMSCESFDCRGPSGSHFFWEQNSRQTTIVVG